MSGSSRLLQIGRKLEKWQWRGLRSYFLKLPAVYIADKTIKTYMEK